MDMATANVRNKQSSGPMYFLGVPPYLLFLFSTALGVLFALAWYVPVKMEGGPVTLAEATIWYFLDSCIWFAFCPLIFFFYRRFPIDVARNRGYGRHLLLALALSWIHLSIKLGLARFLDPRFAASFRTVRAAFTSLFILRTAGGIVIYSLILALFFARDYYAGLRTEREYTAVLESQVAKAELAALRMQLHPHFLFNTLHSVAALIDEQPREAIRMISRLGEFLRVTLESSDTQLVSLDEEIRFVELYFGIEQVRIGDRVQLLVEVDPGTRSVLVPNLILQPLVENALQHGAWQEARNTRVIVSSRNLGDSVEILVRNELESGAADRATPIKEGVGLSNVRSRLQQLYPARFTFNYGWVSSGLFQVSLVLPVSTGQTPS